MKNSLAAAIPLNLDAVVGILTRRNEPGTSAWYKKWFDSSFYHQLYSYRDEKEAAVFIDALIEMLKPRENSHMLDLGCGSGRHSKYLSSKGFQVTGLDLSSSSIRKARQSTYAGLQFSVHDMRVPFGWNLFDYVFNFFTSFGYFDDPREDDQVICNISDSLKQGGLLVMDYINSAYSEQQLVASEIKEIDGIIYHITRWTDKKHFYKKIRIEDVSPEGPNSIGPNSTGPIQFVERVAKFNLAQFNEMFERNGLYLQSVYGDYRLNDYENTSSPRLIMLAKKN